MATSRPLKVKPCHHWEEKGTCLKGDDCLFAHRPQGKFALSKPPHDFHYRRPSSHKHQNQGKTYYTRRVRFEERDYNVGGSYYRNQNQVRSYHDQDGSHHSHQDQVPSKPRFDHYYNKHENNDDRYRSPNPNYKRRQDSYESNQHQDSYKRDQHVVGSYHRNQDQVRSHHRDQHVVGSYHRNQDQVRSHHRDQHVVGSYHRNQDQVRSHHTHHDQVPHKRKFDHDYEIYKNDDYQCRTPNAYSDCTPIDSHDNKNDAYNPKRVKYNERDTPRLQSSIIEKGAHYSTKDTLSPCSVSNEQHTSPNHFDKNLRNNNSLPLPRNLNDGTRDKVEEENKHEDTFHASKDDLFYDYPSRDQEHLEDVEDGELKEDYHLVDVKNNEVEMENDLKNDKEDKVEEDDNKPATNGDPQSKCDSNDGDVDCDSCKELKVSMKKASVQNAMLRNRLEDLQNLYLELEKAEQDFQHTLSSIKKYLL